MDGDDADLNGIQSENGDILLSSRETMDLATRIVSTNGDIALISRSTITQSNRVSTANGSVIVSTLGDYNMAATAQTVANDQVLVNSGDNVRLGLISATEIGISASNSILDNNATQLNLVANRVSIRSLNGSIGQSSPSSPRRTTPMRSIPTSIRWQQVLCKAFISKKRTVYRSTALRN